MGIVVLESVRSEYEHVLKLKSNLEREVQQYKNEILILETATNSVIDHLKEQTEQISLEKVSWSDWIQLENILFIWRKNWRKTIWDYVPKSKN